ncbi:DNA-binding protein [Fervidicoccus fontis]|uniref:DNA-binding protein FFONT_1257 n=2 Tax=Fervidicoccus fontis TaxID=683846 RepID=I0A2N8_FERFK|nr:DNA-binding protein [Fervidicoccus fontis]AFH43245.1 DNA-binding TFAR19-related protein [Fervidicoccus fontis Kam940]MBE9390625.1 DNA-binding protein [Fervidicoccus fontis]PMB75777.1 MAG: DNA-binding protein [Fervidicoccus fontis]PMB76496.1 MAG: DNA-binding protein [Fervidicoccus fontis]HEW63453.1 DNA-binding protein [Fervidicoccus fontis]
MSDEYNDEELAEIEQRKLLELQRRMEMEERRRRATEAEAQKQEILRKILTPQARDRLNNVKLVRPELAEAIENQLIVLAQSGRITEPITEEQIKELLAEITTRSRKEFNIKIREKE